LSQQVADANEQTRQWCEKLSKAIVLVKQGTDDCSVLDALVNDWWEQPAQFATPWITVDGKNVKQWREQFAALRHRLLG
jgi:hypothetical protein